MQGKARWPLKDKEEMSKANQWGGGVQKLLSMTGDQGLVGQNRQSTGRGNELHPLERIRVTYGGRRNSA